MTSYRDKRRMEGWLSEHFRAHEFKCPCCGVCGVQLRLIDALEKLRKKLGNAPIHITSGFRCWEHNEAVGGAPKSRHVTGEAADIIVEGRHDVEVIDAAERIEPFSHGGIGKYGTFVHLDVRHGGPARWTG